MNKWFNSLYFVLIVGFVIRFLFAFSYDTGDTGAFCHASDLFLAGKEVYADKSVYFSAPPFGLHITALSNQIGRILNLSCTGMWKMPAILADMGLGYLIYLIAINVLKEKQKGAISMVRWYIFNPIAIFVSGFHGQQDSFWLFFVILAWYVLIYRKKLVLSAVIFSIALAYKIPSILLLPGLVLSIKALNKRIIFLSIVIALFCLSLFPEIITSTHSLVRQSFMYSSTPDVWGFTNITAKLSLWLGLDSTPKIIYTFFKAVLAIALIIYFVKLYLDPKRNFIRSSLVILSLFLFLTPGFGIQYLLWLLPFLILDKNVIMHFYTYLVTFVYLHTYGLSFPPFSLIMNFLVDNIYFKTPMLFPYDLYFPVWILCAIIAFGKEKVFVKKVSTNIEKGKRAVSKIKKRITKYTDGKNFNNHS